MSSDGERSPKRQRRSFSPESPAAETKTTSFVQPPQTPPPSVHMSPSWQSQQLPANANANASSGVTFPTPPSTAGFQSQPAGTMGGERESHAEDSERQSPNDEVENERKRKREEGDDDGTPNKRHEGEDDVQMAGEDAEHRRTDHERQEDNNSIRHEENIPPQQDEEPAPPAPKLYKLHTEPIAPSRPRASQNIISLYGLERIQASVARKDAQGNKINKLRKSYENKVKALGLEGRSKAQVGNAALEGLLDPVWDMEVEPGVNVWHQQRVAEHPALTQASADELLGRLDAALSLAPGQLPKQEHEHWKGILGLDDSKPTPALQASKAPVVANPALARTASGQVARASAPASPRAGVSSAMGGARPDRAGKRRRYDESSYEGYDEDGYSTGGIDDTGGRRGSGSKRQKRKDFPTAPSPPFSAGGNNSMVGVRSS